MKGLLANVVELTQDEYVALLMQQKDPVKRGLMKRLAFAAMYSGRPGAKVLMPIDLLPEVSS